MFGSQQEGQTKKQVMNWRHQNQNSTKIQLFEKCFKKQQKM